MSAGEEGWRVEGVVVAGASTLSREVIHSWFGGLEGFFGDVLGWGTYQFIDVPAPALASFGGVG